MKKEVSLIDKDLLLKIQEKGFKPKTVSTGWTMKCCIGDDHKIGEPKPILINERCILLLLSEIKDWLRIEHKIEINIVSNVLGYDVSLYDRDKLKFIDAENNMNITQTYKEALELGIRYSLIYIKDNMLC